MARLERGMGLGLGDSIEIRWRLGDWRQTSRRHCFQDFLTFHVFTLYVVASGDRLVDAMTGQIKKTPRDIRASFSGVRRGRNYDSVWQMLGLRAMAGLEEAK